jgi:hypothetical protein
MVISQEVITPKICTYVGTYFLFNSSNRHVQLTINTLISPHQLTVYVALGGLVVSVLATGPTEGDGFLRVIKIRSTTFFGGEVKPWVPCRRFTACKRTFGHE